MDDDDEPVEHTPWTEQGAARLTAAAQALASAVIEHARDLAAARGESDVPRVFAASEALLPVVLAYSDTQFDFTGTAFPFGMLQELAEDDEDWEEEDDVVAGPGISVLSRQDYVVTDEGAVLSAGREAYLRVWPDDSPEDAEADVTHLGRALYQVAHSDGWDGLHRVQGLSATGGSTVVIQQPQPLAGDPNDWPEDPFDTEGTLLYRQDDVYGVRPAGGA